MIKYKYSKYNTIIKKINDLRYIYNTFTGSLCELEDEIYQKIKGEAVSKDELFCAERLIEQGIIVSEKIDETQQILDLEKAEMYNSNPSQLTYVIVPTMACNMDCVYCFEGKHDAASRMTNETIQQVIDYILYNLQKFKSVHQLNISWFGGEPLLELKTIIEISRRLIEYCKKHEVAYNAFIVTNGFLLDAETANILKYQCKINGAQITLDGTEEYYCKQKRVTPQTYKTVLNNIIAIKEILSIEIRLNAVKSNIIELEKLYELFKAHDLLGHVKPYIAVVRDYACTGESKDYFSFGEFTPWLIDFYKRIEKTYNLKCTQSIINCNYRPTSCALIRSTNAVIGTMGELYCCEHDIGHEDRIIGDCTNGLYHNRFHAVVLNPKHRKKCLNCPLFPICLGGCMSEKDKFGENAVDCKGKMKALLHYWNEYIKKEVLHESID